MSDRLIIFTNYIDIFLKDINDNLPYDIKNWIYQYYKYNRKIVACKNKFKRSVLTDLLYRTKSLNKTLINKPIYNLCTIEGETGFIKHVNTRNFKGWVIRNYSDIEYNDHLKYLIKKHFIFYKCVDCNITLFTDELIKHICSYNCKNIEYICYAFKFIDRNTDKFYSDYSRDIRTLKNIIRLQRFSKCVIKALKVYLINEHNEEDIIIKFIYELYLKESANLHDIILKSHTDDSE